MITSPSSPRRAALFDQTNGIAPAIDVVAVPPAPRMHRVLRIAIAGFGGLGR